LGIYRDPWPLLCLSTEWYDKFCAGNSTSKGKRKFFTVHQQGRGWRIEDGNSHRLVAQCPTKNDADMVVNGLIALDTLQEVARLSGVGQLRTLLDIASGRDSSHPNTVVKPFNLVRRLKPLNWGWRRLDPMLDIFVTRVSLDARAVFPCVKERFAAERVRMAAG
jgi:hypothetical protein